jgi:hypothetical protein
MKHRPMVPSLLTIVISFTIDVSRSFYLISFQSFLEVIIRESSGHDDTNVGSEKATDQENMEPTANKCPLRVFPIDPNVSGSLVAIGLAVFGFILGSHRFK